VWQLVLDDHRDPDLGALAVLAIVPTRPQVIPPDQRDPSAHRDHREEDIDFYSMAMLSQGFGLVTSAHPAALLALPDPGRWTARWTRDRRHLAIQHADNPAIHLASPTATSPRGWVEAVHRQRRVVLLMASTDVASTDAPDPADTPHTLAEPAETLERARRDGRLTGAALPATPTASSINRSPGRCHRVH
jgi:hypothetical protein